MTRVAALVALVIGTRVAAAQAPAPDDKGDAKALMQSGVRLLESKDYLGALAVFKGAYARFPSAKILLNIGTTQKLLDRKADAANSYQRYLDSSDADPAHRPEVTEAVADLDKSVGRLEITVTPDDAEIQISDDWMPAKAAHVWRVLPGDVTVKARRTGYTSDAKSAKVAAGEHVAVVIALLAIPAPIIQPVIVTAPHPDEDLHATVEPGGPRARIGALATVHVSVAPKLGSALLVGGTADVTDNLSLDAALILGPGLVASSTMYTTAPPSFGVYPGASFAFLTGDLRPRASVGFPVFFSNGARISARLAGGVEYVWTRHVAAMFDLGVEYELNPQNDIRQLAVVPSVSVSGRL